MQQANRNVQQGNNMLQTAEGGLNQIHSILGRMRELAVQSASDGLNAGDRAKNLTTEDNSIGGNMVNDSSLGSTKVASFAANGSYTLQAEKADGSSTSDLSQATQFTLTV